MEKKVELEVLLNMIDKACCVVTDDPFAEERCINTYILEDKVEEKVSPFAISNNNGKFKNLRDFNTQFKDCHLCNNCLGRDNVYLGFGSVAPLAAFIGDGPMQSDKTLCKIFSGQEGVELLKWIGAVHLDKREIYITNMVKCLNTKRVKEFPCVDFIKEEIDLVKPKAIMILGQFAAQKIFKNKHTIDEYRAMANLSFDNIPVLVTYHPRDTIKNPELKRTVWGDLKKFATLIGIEGRLKG